MDNLQAAFDSLAARYVVFGLVVTLFVYLLGKISEEL